MRALRAGLPALLAALAATALLAALHGDWVLHIADRLPVAPFHASNAWCFDHLAAMLAGPEPLSVTTTRIGYPHVVHLPLMAWVPALLALPLRPWAGPIGAYGLAFLLGPALSVLAASAFFRRALGASPVPAAAGALAYALCPYLLGCAASGQIEKLQAWILPLALLPLGALVEGRRPIRAAAGLLLAVGAAGFTCPSTSLLLPFALAGWAVARVADAAPGTRRAAALRALGGLAAAALVLVAASRHFGDPTTPGTTIQGFAPAFFLPTAERPFPFTVAWGEDLLLGTGPRATGRLPHVAQQVGYLGLPLLVGALLLSVRPFRHRAVGWAAVVGGALLALGPALVWGGEVVEVAGHPVLLPARLLDLAGYPLASSGMWYRAVLLASLGLGAVIAGGGTRWGRVGAVLAVGLALVHLGDGVRATSTLWPRPQERITDRATWAAWRADPAPGAVLDLPLAHSPFEGGHCLLAAIVHGRPTTAMPRFVNTEGFSEARALHDRLRIALDRDDPRLLASVLDTLGFRYVAIHDRGPRTRVDRAPFEAALGPPVRGQGFVAWRVPEAPSTGGAAP